MPNFNLSDNEAYASTLYLKAKLPHLCKYSSGDNNINTPKLIAEDYQCTSCHLLNDKGLDRSINLNSTGYRLKKEWIYETIFYLKAYYRVLQCQFFSMKAVKSRRLLSDQYLVI